MDRLISLLERQPVLRSADARAAGISGRDVIRAVQAERAYRFWGLLVSLEVFADPRIEDAVLCDRSGGVIGLPSAGSRHGLVDVTPGETEIIVPWETRRAPLTMPAKAYRTRNADALSVGVDVEDFYGLQIRMTSPARTVVDLYRLDGLRQHSVTALNRLIDSADGTTELAEVAGRFGAWDSIRPEVEAIIEARNGGMRP